MRKIVLGMVLLLTLGLAAPAAADDEPGGLDGLGGDDLGGLIGPWPLDPVIALLVGLPVPYTPYRSDVCLSGEISCIDAVIVEMQRRLDQHVATCSHRTIFSLAYLRVTENVRDAVASGHFDDTVWLNRVDGVFADMYFDTLDAWAAGQPSKVPAAWRIALKAEDDRAMSGLGNFMLAMNAHINRDFPHALAIAGLRAEDGTSHKPDHNAYNTRLDSLYEPVFAEEAARFDPTFDDIDVMAFEETIAGVIMRGWREMVWRHAEALVIARSGLQRALVEAEIEEYAATQARIIRSMFARRDSSVRDAWCALHGAG